MDVATLQAALEELVKDIGNLRTQVNRVERKVYRAQDVEGPENGGKMPSAASVELRTGGVPPEWFYRG